MRHKFSIQRNDENDELNIKEYANLDREYKNKFLKVDQEWLRMMYNSIFSYPEHCKSLRHSVKRH